MRRALGLALFTVGTVTKPAQAQPSSAVAVSGIDANGNQVGITLTIAADGVIDDTSTPASAANQAVTSLVEASGFLISAGFKPVGPALKITYPDTVIGDNDATVVGQQALLSAGPNVSLVNLEQLFRNSPLYNFPQNVSNAVTPIVEAEVSAEQKSMNYVMGFLLGTILGLPLLGVLLYELSKKCKERTQTKVEKYGALEDGRALAAGETNTSASAPLQGEVEEGEPEPGTGRAPGRRCSIQ